MIARQSVMTWPKGSHGNTYGGNPLACAASLATIKLLEEGYMQNAVDMGEYILDILHEIIVRHPSIGDVRGKGLMIGVEFVQDRVTKEPAEKLRDRIVDLAFQTGLLTLGCGRSVIRIAPPLSVSRSEVDEGMEIFEAAITSAEQEPEYMHAA
jgi:4-aminobutyrate aminotransferase